MRILLILAIICGPVTLAEARDSGSDAYILTEGKAQKKLAFGSFLKPVIFDHRNKLTYRFPKGKITASTLTSKKTLWTGQLTIPRTDFIHGVYSDNEKVVGIQLSQTLWAFDKKTGKKLYQVQWPWQRAQFLMGSRVLRSSVGGKVECLDLIQGKQLWSRQFQGTKRLIRSIEPGILHLDNKKIYFNPSNGKRLVKIPTKATETKDLLFTKTAVFRLSADKPAKLVAYSPVTFKKLWSLPNLGASRILRQVGHGRLLLASANKIFIVQIDKKKLLGSFAFKSNRGDFSIIQKKNAIVACDGQVISCFEPKTGRLRWTTKKASWCLIQDGSAGEILQFNSSKTKKTTSGLLRSLALKNGQENWRWSAPAFKHPFQMFAGVKIRKLGPSKLLVFIHWNVME